MKTQLATSNNNPEENIKLLLDYLRRVGEYMEEAARLLCKMVDEDDGILAKIREKEPRLTEAFLTSLIRVGEGSMRKELLLNSCPAYRRLRSLPYTSQAAILDSGAIEVVVDIESGDALRVSVVDLTPDQVKQVFSVDGKRSKDEQRAFLRRATSPSPKINAEPPAYFVKKDVVYVTRAPLQFSKAELLNLLAEIS